LIVDQKSHGAHKIVFVNPGNELTTVAGAILLPNMLVIPSGARNLSNLSALYSLAILPPRLLSDRAKSPAKP
jgi:hypothetical protein